VHNVFVIGASAFPQNGGYNPTGTVGALTFHALEAIKARYLRQPEPLLEFSRDHRPGNAMNESKGRRNFLKSAAALGPSFPQESRPRPRPRPTPTTTSSTRSTCAPPRRSRGRNVLSQAEVAFPRRPRCRILSPRTSSDRGEGSRRHRGARLLRLKPNALRSCTFGRSSG